MSFHPLHAPSLKVTDADQLIRAFPGVSPEGLPPAGYRAATRGAWLARCLLRFAHRCAAAFGRLFGAFGRLRPLLRRAYLRFAPIPFGRLYHQRTLRACASSSFLW